MKTKKMKQEFYRFCLCFIRPGSIPTKRLGSTVNPTHLHASNNNLVSFFLFNLRFSGRVSVPALPIDTGVRRFSTCHVRSCTPDDRTKLFSTAEDLV